MANWIIDNGQNQITVTINNKTVPLRYTVYQQECYTKMLGAAANEKKEIKSLVDRIEQMTVSAMDVAVIALNPKPNEIAFTRDQISEYLDLDQIALLAEVFIKHKIFSPTLEKKL